MQKYHIKRIDPNTGQVWETGPFGEDLQTTDTMPYTDCKVYLLQHQVELRVYKVGRIGSRKNAKRRMHKRIFATGFVEAVEIFSKIDPEDATLQLCTGDWKVLVERKPNGEMKYYLK